MALKGLPSAARFSPSGKYAYGYNEIDSTWYTYNVQTNKFTQLTKGTQFYNEAVRKTVISFGTLFNNIELKKTISFFT